MEHESNRKRNLKRLRKIQEVLNIGETTKRKRSENEDQDSIATPVKKLQFEADMDTPSQKDPLNYLEPKEANIQQEDDEYSKVYEGIFSEELLAPVRKFNSATDNLWRTQHFEYSTKFKNWLITIQKPIQTLAWYCRKILYSLDSFYGINPFEPLLLAT
jgi:hypothetical protein